MKPHSANAALKASMKINFNLTEAAGGFKSVPPTAAMPAGYAAALKKQQENKDGS